MRNEDISVMENDFSLACFCFLIAFAFTSESLKPIMAGWLIVSHNSEGSDSGVVTYNSNDIHIRRRQALRVPKMYREFQKTFCDLLLSSSI